MASILVIDDDQALRDVLARVLRQSGHTVDEAPDGKSGLARIQAGQYDLIITDIVMPDMEGLELITKLREMAPRPRIIAMSGGSRFSGALYLPTAMRLGVQRTLAKPFGPSDFLRAVAEVLAEPPPPTVSRPSPSDGEAAGEVS